METRTTAIAAYESPETRVIEIEIQSLICTSQYPYGRSTEEYQEGTIPGWGSIND